jgi:hypothetical protein
VELPLGHLRNVGHALGQIAMLACRSVQIEFF